MSTRGQAEGENTRGKVLQRRFTVPLYEHRAAAQLILYRPLFIVRFDLSRQKKSDFVLFVLLLRRSRAHWRTIVHGSPL